MSAKNTKAGVTLSDVLQAVAPASSEYWYEVACELHRRQKFYELLDCWREAEKYLATIREAKDAVTYYWGLENPITASINRPSSDCARASSSYKIFDKKLYEITNLEREAVQEEERAASKRKASRL